jgi:GH15 family glucan-1,4-alpha-glucosidase
MVFGVVLTLLIEKQAYHNKYEEAAREAADYLVSQIGSDGYLPAAKDYRWYKPHWFRDTSWVAAALLRYAGHLKERGQEYKEYLEAANRIIEFNISALEKYIPNLQNSLKISLDDEEFFKLYNHIPARVGRSKELYKEDGMDDTPQKNVARSWLLQYDTIPLILMALYKKNQIFGLDNKEVEFLKSNVVTIANYLGKIFGTECASAWEIEPELLHAYDVAAIHFAFKVLSEFSEQYDLGIDNQEIEHIKNTLYKGDPLQFLRRFFVHGDVLYRAKRSFENKPLLEKGVGSSAIFIFLNFGITGIDLGAPEIEKNTIERIEADLFNGNMLPIRFLGDTYFNGGRWLLLGLSFAEYYANTNRLEKAKEILDYVIDKYNGSYPEQELVNPASPGADEERIKENGGKPIQDLAWSYAAVITASLAVLSAMQESMREAMRR